MPHAEEDYWEKHVFETGALKSNTTGAPVPASEGRHYDTTGNNNRHNQSSSHCTPHQRNNFGDNPYWPYVYPDPPPLSCGYYLYPPPSGTPPPPAIPTCHYPLFPQPTASKQRVSYQRKPPAPIVYVDNTNRARKLMSEDDKLIYDVKTPDVLCGRGAPTGKKR